MPRQYIPAVEKGVRSAMVSGILAGYPVTDVKVALYDGSFHTVDSSDLAFQIAGGLAIRKAVMEAGPVLLEPIVIIEATVPEEFMGAVNGDLNSRRGRIMGMEAAGHQQTVKAQVPLAEVLKYATDLRSMTQGRGSYEMHFSHYDVVPQQVATRVIAESKQAVTATETHA